MQVAGAILAGACLYGHDVRELASRFGLAPDDLMDPDARIPASTGVAMWDEVPRIVGDDLFGLRLARRASEAGTLPIVGYIVQTSPTLGEGLSRALRYQRLVQTLNPASLRVDGAVVRLEVAVRPPYVQRLRHAVDFAFAFVVSFVARLTGRPLVPRRARFAYSAPSTDREHRQLFGSDLRFGAPRTELVMDASELRRPVPTADPQLRRLIEHHADALLSRLPARDSVADRVRAAVLDGLPRGAAGLDAVARTMRTSRRTLQRMLAADGTSHAVLVDEVRKQLALRQVADGSLSLAEVAFFLGFADQTTFHRAFVRWTGRSPGAYRKLEARATF